MIVSRSINQTQSPDNAKIDFIDFGCGAGKSMEFASSLIGGIGYGIDLSQEAVGTCLSRGFDARVGDLISFQDKNAADVTLAIDVFPELPDLSSLESGFLSLLRASRHFSLIQHQYFDGDSQLALRGAYIKSNFGRRVKVKPTIADYISLTYKYLKVLNIVGLAILGIGKTECIYFSDIDHDEQPPIVTKSLRVIIGRKDVARFRRALTKVAAGNTLYLWEDQS